MGYISIGLIDFGYMFVNGIERDTIPSDSKDSLMASDFNITVINNGTPPTKSDSSTYLCGENITYKVKILKPDYKFAKVTQDISSLRNGLFNIIMILMAVVLRVHTLIKTVRPLQT